MSLNFLHLSDLHIDSRKLTDIEIVIDALFKDIEKQNIRIDFIFFTGDLINNGALGLNEEYQYDIAQEKFIKPLLDITKVPKDRFFIVPGNHDVNREKIKPFIDENLSDKFSNREQLNDFIDNIEENDSLLKRLEDFNIFIDLFYNGKQTGLLNRNSLWATYRVNYQNIDVGIACLNTSWAAYGGEQDYGKLLMSERQIYHSLKSLGDCDLKIALFHHPIEWLKEFDRNSVKRSLLESFDLIFTGHIHDLNTSKIISNVANTVFIQCGSLYQGRIYNGYSIVEYDDNLKEVKIKLREYFDKRKEFDRAISIISEGIQTYTLGNQEKLDVYKRNIDVIETIKNGVYSDIDRKLLTSISLDTMAPKKVEEIFVKPLISDEPEGYIKPDKEFINLQEIINADYNVLFLGKKESGKSTLLDYLCKHYINESSNSKIIIPFIIDFRDLPKGKNIFEKAMMNYLMNYGVYEFDLETNLKEGNCLLLIDNVDFNDTKNLSILGDFYNKYKANRIIMTADENILHSIGLEEIPDIGLEYKAYYIYSLRRSQIRELVNKWYSKVEIDREMLLDRVMGILKAIGIPRTPLAVSLILWIIEKQSNYDPVNESALIEKFIETLLEKLNFEEAKYGAIDFTIKSDFLAFLAYNMVINNKFYFEIEEFNEIASKYFEQKGLDIDIEKVRKDFLTGGLLIIRDNKIYFVYKCFFEFFVAKYMDMPENKEFREYILSEDMYINYKNEIVYLTGLNRKSKDIMMLIRERLINSFKEIERSIDIKKLDDRKINSVLYNELKKRDISKDLETIKLTTEQKDIILDATDYDNDSQHIIEKKKEDIKETFSHNLELYSKILRNCELLDKKVKEEALATCINKYCILIGFIFDIFEKIIEEKLENGETIDELNEQFNYILTVGVPLMIQLIALENLGSPKLNLIISEQIKKANTDIEKFMLVSLYSDMRLPGYIEVLHTFISEIKTDFIRELILAKLLYYNSLFILPKDENKQIANLIAEILVKKNREKKIAKSYYINLYEKKNMLNQKIALKEIIE